MLDDKAIDLLFDEARTPRAFTDRPVPEATLRRIYDLAKMPPTSANCQPMRIVFVTSREAKEKLRPCLSEGNTEKSMIAPVVAIVAYDLAFHEHLPRLFPFADARSWFTGNDAKILETAFRNGSLQGAYLIMAARALGLDCGPMSGFDNAKLDEAFFAGTTLRSNFLCIMGHGDFGHNSGRAPRFDFDEACTIA